MRNTYFLCGLALAMLTTAGAIGFTIKDHPSVIRHLDRFCPALCTN
jgi:hypothetical protein